MDLRSSAPGRGLQAYLGLATATLIVSGCASATRMARPAHVPEATWTTCDTETATPPRYPGTARNRVEASLELFAAGPPLSQPGAAVSAAAAGALFAGAIGSAVTRAMAPDATTADAWSWNHTMRSCLEDRGIRLP